MDKGRCRNRTATVGHAGSVFISGFCFARTQKAGIHNQNFKEGEVTL